MIMHFQVQGKHDSNAPERERRDIGLQGLMQNYRVQEHDNSLCVAVTKVTLLQLAAQKLHYKRGPRWHNM